MTITLNHQKKYVTIMMYRERENQTLHIQDLASKPGGQELMSLASILIRRSTVRYLVDLSLHEHELNR